MKPEIYAKQRQAIIEAAREKSGTTIADLVELLRIAAIPISSRMQLLCKGGVLFSGRVGNNTRFFAKAEHRDAWVQAERDKRPQKVRQRAPCLAMAPRISAEIEEAIAAEYQHASNRSLAEKYGVTVRQVEGVGSRHDLRKPPEVLAENRSAAQRAVANRKQRAQAKQDAPVRPSAVRIEEPEPPASKAPRPPLDTSTAAPRPIPQMITEVSVERGVRVTRSRWVDQPWVEPGHVGEFTAEWRNRRAPKEQRA